MKLRVSFKSPDAVYYAVAEAVRNLEPETPEEKTDFLELDGDLDRWRSWQAKQLTEFTERWVQHEETITVEFDTTAGTARLVEVY